MLQSTRRKRPLALGGAQMGASLHAHVYTPNIVYRLTMCPCDARSSRPMKPSNALETGTGAALAALSVEEETC